MSTQRFAIIYADGTVYEGGGEGDEIVELTIKVSRDWLLAPDDGVIFVLVDEHATNKVALQGGDFYFPFPSGEGVGFANYLGPYLRGFLPGLVKFGQYVSGSKFLELLQVAKAMRKR